VDDHPAFRLVIKTHLLQLLGTQEVFEADNGQSAMEMARQFVPDLTILDALSHMNILFRIAGKVPGSTRENTCQKIIGSIFTLH